MQPCSKAEVSRGTTDKESRATKLKLQTSNEEIRYVLDIIAADDTLSMEKINMLTWEVGFWPLERGVQVESAKFSSSQSSSMMAHGTTVVKSIRTALRDWLEDQEKK